MFGTAAYGNDVLGGADGSAVADAVHLLLGGTLPGFIYSGRGGVVIAPTAKSDSDTATGVDSVKTMSRRVIELATVFDNVGSQGRSSSETGVGIDSPYALPTLLAGLAGWWKADAISASNGETNFSWPDSSGLGRTLADGDGFTYVTNQIQGLPVVRCAGGPNDYAMSSSVALSSFVSTSAFTYWIVLRLSSVLGDSSNPTLDDWVFGSSALTLGMVARSSRVMNYARASADADHADKFFTPGEVLVIECRHESGNLYISINGGNETVVSAGNTSALTGNLVLGRPVGATGAFSGDVGEIVVSNVAEKPPARAGVRQYLRRWLGSAVIRVDGSEIPTFADSIGDQTRTDDQWGLGVDSLGAFDPGSIPKFGSETATGSDSVGDRTLAQAETATGTDSASNQSRTSSESGTGTDSVSGQGRSGSDSATGTDTGTLPPQPAPFITGQSGGSLRGSYDDYVGFRFTVGASSIEVSALGRWVVSGNSGSHRVRIITSANVEVAAIDVDTSGATAGAFKYVNLGSPVTLSAGASYACMSLESSSGPADQWYDENRSVSHTAAASGITPCYSNYSNSPGGTDKSYVPPNFLYI